MRAVDVTSLDLKARLTEMAEAAPVGANRLHGFLAVVTRWAHKLGTLPDNPTVRVDRARVAAARRGEIGVIWRKVKVKGRVYRVGIERSPHARWRRAPPLLERGNPERGIAARARLHAVPPLPRARLPRRSRRPGIARDALSLRRHYSTVPSSTRATGT